MDEKELSKQMAAFENEVKGIFPKFEFAYSSAFSVNDIYKEGIFEFAIRQSSLQETDYVSNLGNEFIHYTSLERFFNILNEGAIRLYDINHKNDPKEFEFLLNKHDVELDKDQIEHFKRSSHIFSMCKYNEEDGDNFDMWRNYGLGGDGIGIVFEILNNEWNYFLLGSIQYEDNLENESKICALLKIAEKYRSIINPKKLPLIFGSLPLFHKSEIWRSEEEVRVACTYEYEPYFLEEDGRMFSIVSSMVKFYLRDGLIGSYVSLPLDINISKQVARIGDTDEREKSLNLYPRFRIKKIITGFRFSQTDSLFLQRVIWYHNRLNSDSIVVQASKHTKHFKK